MNPDGGFYNAVQELHYEEDDAELSLHLSDTDDNNDDHADDDYYDDDDDDDDGFLDALQEQLMAADEEYVSLNRDEDKPRSDKYSPNIR